MVRTRFFHVQFTTALGNSMYYVWVSLLILGMGLGWLTTLFTLPGNWIVVGLAALFAWLLPPESGGQLSWFYVGVAAVLALLGEGVELAAGAAGAKKQGASRRSMVLALVGTVLGSLLGAVVSLPIPIVGPIIGALGGGALGAFGGAYLGETWKGRDPNQRMAAGQGALVGRLFGTVGKLMIGAVMVVVIAVDALV
jgi:uncharacterized protein YqgC (DUF456 family)